MRIMALDVGNKRIGVALSDPTETLAQGITVVYHRSRQADAEAVLALAREHEVGEIVVGYPLLLSGRPGEQARAARRLGGELARKGGLPVVYWDERLTTAAARRLMHEAGISSRNQAQRIDAAAAELILQSYLDSRKREQR
jgi:putative Holliday junction resolvase